MDNIAVRQMKTATFVKRLIDSSEVRVSGEARPISSHILLEARCGRRSGRSPPACPASGGPRRESVMFDQVGMALRGDQRDGLNTCLVQIWRRSRARRIKKAKAKLAS